MASGEDKKSSFYGRLFDLVREKEKEQTFAKVGVELYCNCDPTNSTGSAATMCYGQYRCSFFFSLLSCRAKSGSSLYSCVEKITPVCLLIVWVTVSYLPQLLRS